MGDPGTMTIPEPGDVTAPTTLDELDRVVARVADHRKQWLDTGIDERIELLRALRATLLEVAPDWARLAADAKGIPPASSLRGEDWLTGPALTVRQVRLLQETLEQIRDDGRPDVELRARQDGQVTAKVFPTGPLDALLFPRMTGEVWLQPDVTVDRARREQAGVHRGEPGEGGVCAVLGAGNVSSIPPMDVLTKLFNENLVVVLKMNPVNAHLGPVLERGLAPLVELGVLAVVYGGREVGEHLVDHELVDTLHLTGSDKTFDAIVWGPGEEGRRAKQEGRRRVTKPFTAELGNVTPVIVVPGPWSASDIRHQAESIASMLVQNAGFNCVTARVVVNHGKWARRRDLLDDLREALRGAEQRVPYYPGAVDRWRELVTAHPQAESLGVEGPDQVPWTLVPDVDASATDASAFRTESFCGAVAETAIDAPLSIPDYLRRAVAFCNDTLWGTLSATILVHPRSLRDPAVAEAVEQAIADLRYGTVAVNVWSAVAYGMVSTSWGAYPGATDEDIQSGRGVVHNTTMLADVQKSVVRAPFKPPMKPVTNHDHSGMEEVASRLTTLEATGDLTALPSMLWHAMRG